MKACVIDTHAFLWHLSNPAKLGRRARAILKEVDSGKRRGLIPAVSAVELAILQERGRSDIGPAEVEAAIENNPFLEVLPLDLDQVHEFAALKLIKDPFDRLIAAAALSARCPLLTTDGLLAACGAVEVVWDQQARSYPEGLLE